MVTSNVNHEESSVKSSVVFLQLIEAQIHDELVAGKKRKHTLFPSQQVGGSTTIHLSTAGNKTERTHVIIAGSGCTIAPHASPQQQLHPAPAVAAAA